MKMVMRHSWVILLCVALIGCDKHAEQREKLQEKLDNIEGINAKAQRNLVVNPALIKDRCDSMEIIVQFLQKNAMSTIGHDQELSLAFGYYQSALKAFKQYRAQHDEIVYDAEQYAKAITSARETVENWDGDELEQLQDKLQKIEEKVKANYVQSTELMRRYLGVVNPYHRKKKQIHNLYARMQTSGVK